MRAFTLCIFSTLYIVGCTNGGKSAMGTDPVSPIAETPTIPGTPIAPTEILPPVSKEFTEPASAQQKVSEVIQTLNQDPAYEFVSDDMALLESEGLLSEKK